MKTFIEFHWCRWCCPLLRLEWPMTNTIVCPTVSGVVFARKQKINGFFLTNETARLLAVFVSLMPAWVKEVWLSRLPQSRCAGVLMQISPRYLLFWRSVAFSPAIIRISLPLSLSLRSKVLSPSPTCWNKVKSSKRLFWNWRHLALESSREAISFSPSRQNE